LRRSGSCSADVPAGDLWRSARAAAAPHILMR